MLKFLLPEKLHFLSRCSVAQGQVCRRMSFLFRKHMEKSRHKLESSVKITKNIPSKLSQFSEAKKGPSKLCKFSEKKKFHKKPRQNSYHFPKITTVGNPVGYCYYSQLLLAMYSICYAKLNDRVIANHAVLEGLLAQAATTYTQPTGGIYYILSCR